MNEQTYFAIQYAPKGTLFPEDVVPLHLRNKPIFEIAERSNPAFSTSPSPFQMPRRFRLQKHVYNDNAGNATIYWKKL
jgi:hypothetical protein